MAEEPETPTLSLLRTVPHSTLNLTAPSQLILVSNPPNLMTSSTLLRSRRLNQFRRINYFVLSGESNCYLHHLSPTGFSSSQPSFTVYSHSWRSLVESPQITIITGFLENST